MGFIFSYIVFVFYKFDFKSGLFNDRFDYWLVDIFCWVQWEFSYSSLIDGVQRFQKLIQDFFLFWQFSYIQDFFDFIYFGFDKSLDEFFVSCNKMIFLNGLFGVLDRKKFFFELNLLFFFLKHGDQLLNLLFDLRFDFDPLSYWF